MSNISIASLAAATAVVGYNCIGGEEKRNKPFDRVLVAYGCTGSTAAGDTILQVRVGGEIKAKLINTATGVAITRDHMLGDRILVPAEQELEVVVEGAPTTNPIAIRLVLVP